MRSFRLLVLWTDLAFWGMLLSAALCTLFLSGREQYRRAWTWLWSRRAKRISLLILGLYGTVAALDSVHLRLQGLDAEGRPLWDTAGRPVYAADVRTPLDLLVGETRTSSEKTYSSPLASRQFVKESLPSPDGTWRRDYPRLRFGGAHLKDAEASTEDIAGRIMRGMGIGLLAGAALTAVMTGVAALRTLRRSPATAEQRTASLRETLRSGLRMGLPLGVLALAISIVFAVASGYHVLGTDKVGQDVLYRVLKSCRTGLLVGLLSTLIATPFALVFGIATGYLGGWLDDVVQYLYATIASIPSVLLVAACMLLLQGGRVSDSSIHGGDRRLFWLCAVLGLIGWTTLCRVLRGQTLKLREMDYVQASRALGASSLGIMGRHILPNVGHIVLITVVLRFSTFVLSEAVLAYVGIGLDPLTESWGSMINAARTEVSREPSVWWTLAAAFASMVGLVLPANILGEAVRDALDPRLNVE